jgi:WD40 repeat protein
VRANSLLLLVCLTGFSVAQAAPVTALGYSPNGTALAGNGQRCIELRSPADAAVQHRIPCALPRITSLAFHPGGQFLAAGGGNPGLDGEVLIMDWREHKTLYQLADFSDLVTSVSFNAEGALLGAASADGTARVWKFPRDGSAPSQAFNLKGHAGPVLTIRFSPTGESVVTAGADRSLKVWSAHDGTLLRTLSHHTEAVHALAFLPLDKQASGGASPAVCATSGDDRTVRIWQPETGRMVRIVRQHQGAVFCLAFSPDGTTLYSAGKEGVVRRLDTGSDAILGSWPAQPDWIYSMAVSPDGAKLATGDWSGNVRILDARLSNSTHTTTGK